MQQGQTVRLKVRRQSGLWTISGSRTSVTWTWYYISPGTDCTCYQVPGTGTLIALPVPVLTHHSSPPAQRRVVQSSLSWLWYISVYTGIHVWIYYRSCFSRKSFFFVRSTSILVHFSLCFWCILCVASSLSVSLLLFAISSQ